MSSRMCRGNKISLTLFGASSPDYHPCIMIVLVTAKKEEDPIKTKTLEWS